MFDLENHCYSVSEVTASIKMLLESRFPQILMEGEISNYRPSGAGHIYFTLKDNQSMIQAVLFRGDAVKLNFNPGDGMKVKARGRITVYPQRGNYQIICSSLEEQGKGSILEMLEERKRRLAAEGLFDEKFKKPLPPYPSRIAVITSPTGAALRDILQVLKRRNSSIDVRILPTAVQGSDAAPQIVEMIERANRFNLGELIILARGGGALEDLLPFSEEEVVRAVSSSYIPIVTGIGHEIDFSLADFAADLRAPTPSAAAELVCASSSRVLENVSFMRREMITALRLRIQLNREKLKPFSSGEISLSFRRYLDPVVLRIDDIRETMKRDITDRIREYRHRLEVLKTGMEGNSPLAIMEKGYSLVTDGDGKTIKDSQVLKNRELVNIRFASGKAAARIEDVE